MNKGLKVAIAVGTFAVAFAVGGAIFFITNNSKKAEQSVKQYFDLLKDKDYEGMYNLISADSKNKISKDDFIKRNKNIYEGINAENIEISVKDNKKDKGNYTVNYDTNMDTAAGTLDFENSVEVSKGDNGYELKWSSNLIFPELDDDNKVRINT